MQKKGFSRREFISLAGATGGAALLAACQGVAPAADSGAGGDASHGAGDGLGPVRLANR